MIVDATCTPANIKFPTNMVFLNEARESLEEIIISLHEKAGKEEKKPRSYKRRARKEYLRFARNRRSRLNAIRQQLGYVKRDLNIVEQMLQRWTAEQKTSKQTGNDSKALCTARGKVPGKEHQIEDRIVSLSQP